jgi:hypothetical protein
MNATNLHNRIKTIAAKNQILHVPGRRLRLETERFLRDMAYVMHLTSRVKEQILENEEEAEVTQ